MCSFLSDVSSKSDDLLSFKMNNNIDKENFAFDVLDSAGRVASEIPISRRLISREPSIPSLSFTYD